MSLLPAGDLTKCEYDFVFVSHLPSFYKINLFNEIAKCVRILVIFLGETSHERTPDFVRGEMCFDYLYLNSGDFECRSRWSSLLQLFHILRNLRYTLISVGAWDLPESWLTILCSPKHKNVITQETSIFESKLTGWKGLLKRIFVKRLGLAMVSGEPHGRLMRSLGFDGQILLTGGVGLANRAKGGFRQQRKFNGRFLYVGRLSSEKNLPFLLRVFALPEMSGFQLTLAGDGNDYAALKAEASRNVLFLGHVPNEEIQEVYASHDVFILPSLSEPWGLVVEEALYYGLPVLVSSKVGSAEDLVLAYGAGLTFDPNSDSDLKRAIKLVSAQYDQFNLAAQAIDFARRDKEQVSVYVDAINARLTR